LAAQEKAKKLKDKKHIKAKVDKEVAKLTEAKAEEIKEA